jgi:hypothetical protein
MEDLYFRNQKPGWNVRFKLGFEFLIWHMIKRANLDTNQAAIVITKISETQPILDLGYGAISMDGRLIIQNTWSFFVQILF